MRTKSVADYRLDVNIFSVKFWQQTKNFKNIFEGPIKKIRDEGFSGNGLQPESLIHTRRVFFFHPRAKDELPTSSPLPCTYM